MILHYRPIDAWPGRLRSADERIAAQFKAHWDDTLRTLDTELDFLGATDAVLQLAVPESSIRLDGGLRADRKPPEHPGVILSFESRHGPLRYWTDAFTAPSYRHVESWRMNARAIALGLEALRKVERYGIANRGEQYAGWAQLTAGIALGAAEQPLSIEDAAALLADAIKRRPADLIGAPNMITYAYRMAAKLLHPDTNPDPAATTKMRRLTEARDLLLGARGE